MSDVDFWSNTQKANKIISRLKSLKAITEPFNKSFKEYEDLDVLASMLEVKDTGHITELNQELDSLIKDVDKLEFKSLLNGEHDINNAIVSINAGAGGTESCDWANMLLRMYNRWATECGYNIKSIDLLPGDEAGLKSSTFIIKGDWAYGYLKGEIGVHRLVRISPFDANKRRHTSFASVDVIAEVTGDIEIEIADNDIRVDV